MMNIWISVQSYLNFANILSSWGACLSDQNLNYFNYYYWFKKPKNKKPHCWSHSLEREQEPEELQIGPQPKGALLLILVKKGDPTEDNITECKLEC